MQEWRLRRYISKFEDEGYDDPAEWEEFCVDDDGTKLEEERLIEKKVPRKKFVRKWRATFGAKQSNNKEKDVWFVCILFVFAFLVFVIIVLQFSILGTNIIIGWKNKEQKKKKNK